MLLSSLLVCLMPSRAHAQTPAQPISLAVDGSNHTWLLWKNPDNSASLWNLDPSGNLVASQTYGPYTDNAPQNLWAPVAVSVAPGGGVHLLWDNTDGRAMFWNVAASLSFTVLAGYGPYTDNGQGLWHAVALATGPDGVSHVLWNNTDHRAMLWDVNADGSFITIGGYGPYTDNAPSALWRAAGVSVGGDNLVHLLWDDTDGRMMFWDANADGSFTVLSGYGPYTDNGQGLWHAASLATAPNGVSHVLWNNTDGRVMFWDVSSGGSETNISGYGPYAGWVGQAIAAGPDSLAHPLWGKADGSAWLWTLNSALGVTSEAEYPSAAGVRLSASSVPGGTSVSGTVTLNSPAVAGGSVVSLTSSAPGAASVPASVTIPAGQIIANFTVVTARSATAATAAITARYNGASPTATLSVTPTAPDFTMSVNPGSLTTAQSNVLGITAQITITPNLTLTSGVTLNVAGLPSGVSASYPTKPITVTSNVTLFVAANPYATTGPAQLVITGTSNGVSHSIALPLTVTATPGYLASIKVAPSKATVAPFKYFQFAARAFDQIGRVIVVPPAQFSWHVLDSSVGFIDYTGNFSARNTGLTSVTAAYGGKAGSAEVIVQPIPATISSIYVSPPTVSVSPGGTNQFSATAIYSDSTTADVTNSAYWGVSGGGGIDKNGLFTAGATPGGPYSVTATLGVVGTAYVTVLSPVTPTPGQLVITPASASIPPGGTQQFTATSYDQNGILLSPQPTFSWTSSGGSSISANPNNTANATLTAGNSTGTYTVTVTASNGQTAQAQVTITTSPTALASVTDLVSYATGANKIALYWTQVPNVIGYNVYRGSYYGNEDYSHPINGSTLVNTPSFSGSDVDVYTDINLTASTVYYYTVKAVYTCGEALASNEDYDTPDPAAVPWDSGNPGSILSAVRNQFSADEPSIANLRVIGPDGSIYDDASGSALPPDGTFNPLTNQVTTPDGSLVTLFDDSYDDYYYYGVIAQDYLSPMTYQGLPIGPSNGPFRRVISQSGFRGVQGQITLPNYTVQTNETADIYMGQTGAGEEVDAGLQSNPGGWGLVLRIGGPYYAPEPAKGQGQTLYDVDDGVRFQPGTVVTLKYYADGNAAHPRLALVIANGAAKAGPTRVHQYGGVQMKRIVAIAQPAVGVVPTGSSVLVPTWDHIQLENPDGTWNDWTAAKTATNANGTFLDGSYDGGGNADISWSPSATSLYTDEDNISIKIHTKLK